MQQLHYAAHAGWLPQQTQRPRRTRHCLCQFNVSAGVYTVSLPDEVLPFAINISSCRGTRITVLSLQISVDVWVSCMWPVGFQEIGFGRLSNSKGLLPETFVRRRS